MKRTKRQNVRRKRGRKPQITLLNIKVSRKDRKALDAAAKKYAKGNLSAWLRFAGTHYHPVFS